MPEIQLAPDLVPELPPGTVDADGRFNASVPLSPAGQDVLHRINHRLADANALGALRVAGVAFASFETGQVHAEVLTVGAASLGAIPTTVWRATRDDALGVLIGPAARGMSAAERKYWQRFADAADFFSIADPAQRLEAMVERAEHALNTCHLEQDVHGRQHAGANGVGVARQVPSDCRALEAQLHNLRARLAAEQRRSHDGPPVTALRRPNAATAPAHRESRPPERPQSMTGIGLVMRRSAWPFRETVTRLEHAARAAGAELFARVDHAANAKRTGFALEPTELLLFGRPEVSTPLIQGQRTAGLDLPMKVLVWRSGDETWIGYNDIAYLALRHGVHAPDAVAKMYEWFERLISAAAE